MNNHLNNESELSSVNISKKQSAQLLKNLLTSKKLNIESDNSTISSKTTKQESLETLKKILSLSDNEKSKSDSVPSKLKSLEALRSLLTIPTTQEVKEDNTIIVKDNLEKNKDNNINLKKQLNNKKSITGKNKIKNENIVLNNNIYSNNQKDKKSNKVIVPKESKLKSGNEQSYAGSAFLSSPDPNFVPLPDF